MSCFKQAVLVIRWLPGATRVRQLAAGNAIGKTTACVRLHEGTGVLATQAPNLHGALLAARAAGYSHVNTGGTLIETEAGSRFQLTIWVDDADAVCAELDTRGVALLNGLMNREWGMRTASLTDPDGNIWEIAQQLPQAEGS